MAAPVEQYVPAGTSHVAVELAALPKLFRRQLHLSMHVVAAVDVVVAICAKVQDDDGRPFIERLGDLEEQFELASRSPEALTTALNEIADADLTRWVKQFERADHRTIVKRALGTAAYDRLIAALHHDGRIVLEAVHEALHHARPWIAALNDASQMLTDAQREESNIPVQVGGSLVAAALNLESLLDATLANDLGLRMPTDRDKIELSEAEVAAALAELRKVMHSRSSAALDELGDVFSRKLQGARDALEHSADGVSQAANSLVELIDRFARQAHSKAEVMEWLATNGIADDVHVYQDDAGVSQPTKRAEVMCMVWAGGPIVDEAEQWSIRKMAAYTMLNTRAKLQKLKHADAGTEEERTMLYDLLNGIEAAAMLMLRACWPTTDGDRVAAMHAKFAG